MYGLAKSGADQSNGVRVSAMHESWRACRGPGDLHAPAELCHGSEFGALALPPSGNIALELVASDNP